MLADLQNLKDAPEPAQAQGAYERRKRVEDFVAHLIAVLLTLGFFALALTALLGLVDLSQPVVATLIGTTLGYAVGQLASVLHRYFPPRSDEPAPEKKP